MSVVSIFSAVGFAFDEEATYVGSGTDLFRIPKDGSAPIALAGLQSLSSIAVQGGQIFWSNGNEGIRSARTRLP